MKNMIFNPKGYGFEELELHSHALIEAQATLVETKKNDLTAINPEKNIECFFLGATNDDALQRLFLNQIEKHKSVLATHLDQVGNPYKINLDSISESLWHAPIGFECFFTSKMNQFDEADHYEYQHHGQAVQRFIDLNVPMTDDVADSDELNPLWTHIRRADMLAPLTSANFPSDDSSNTVRIEKFTANLLKRDEHDQFLDMLDLMCETLSPERIQHNIIKSN